MNIVRHESGMFFECDEKTTFFVEDFTKKNKIQAKAVEFLRVHNGNRVFLIEAKTSAPNISNPESAANFSKYIDDICQKAIDSFSVFMATRIGRHDVVRPECVNRMYSKKTEFTLVLIIKNHNIAWSKQIQLEMIKRLKHFTSSWKWGPRSVLVLNEDGAKKLGLLARAKRPQYRQASCL